MCHLSFVNDIQTLPDNYCLVEPLKITDSLVQDVEQYGDNDQGDSNISYNPITTGNHNYNYFPDRLYKPDFMKMDGTYINNITKPLTFTYGPKPQEIFDNHS